MNKTLLKTYDYIDHNGRLLFQALRFEPKDFRQRRPHNGKFAWGLSAGWYEQKIANSDYVFLHSGDAQADTPPTATWIESVDLILYRLPEVITAIQVGQTIFICEGERDADNMALWGFTATTCPLGAGKWKPTYTKSLSGCKEAIIIADKDVPGRKHASHIAAELLSIGIRVKIIELADTAQSPVKDFTDWLDAGGTKEEFTEVINKAPYYQIPCSQQEVPTENLKTIYGEPYYFNEDGNFTSINESYWAGLHNLEHIQVYEPTEQCFYRYEPNTGLYRRISEDQIKQEISSRMLTVSREQNVPILERKRNNTCLNNIVAQLKGVSEKAGVFDEKKLHYVHLANGVIVLNKEGESNFVSFSPDFFSRNQCPISFDPDAQCPKFLNQLLYPAVNEADSILIQKYVGMCLLGRNIAQRFLILDGLAGRGKSQLALIIQNLVGRENFTELRTQHLSERFELYRYQKRTLLVGVDVPGNFLSQKGASVIKALVGGDWFNAEQKGGNGIFQIQGIFCILITSNSRLQICLDDKDASAWQRRLLVVRFDCPPPIKRIPDFADVLMKEEGPGILNWALHGLAMLLKDIHEIGDIKLDDKQKDVIIALVEESDSLRHFLQHSVVDDKNADLSVEEITEAYVKYCPAMHWNPKPITIIQRQLEDLMLELFSTSKSSSIKRDYKEVKGFRRVRFNKNA